MKYKFSYAVKGFAAYMVYRSVSEYRHYNNRMFLSMNQHGQFAMSVMGYSAVFGGLCLII